jgi:outer membrane lipoprotein-sorting protein
MRTLSALLFFVFYLPAQKNASSTEVLQSMYQRYHGVWHKSLTFNQTTERYRNDSLIKKSTWYETIVYPDLLRIDFDSVKSSGGVIFRRDSTYVFRNKKIVRSTKDENELIFFLGGMYSMQSCIMILQNSIPIPGKANRFMFWAMINPAIR